MDTDSIRVALSAINTKAGTQSRGALQETRIAEYAEAFDALPPITLYTVGSEYWLVDGFHRVAAARKLGHTEIAARVHQGDQRDAKWASLAANKEHDEAGLPRTRGDKTRAIECALTDPEWKKMPDREIAEHIGVNQSNVSRMREHLMRTHKIEPRTEVEATRNGKPYKMNTENIGKPRGPSAAPSQKGRLAESAARRARIGDLHAEGKSNGEIARALDMEPSSISYHLDNLGLNTAETRAGEQVKKIVATLVGISFSIGNLPAYRVPKSDAGDLAAQLKESRESILKLEKQLEKLSR
jgi:DNA-binding transcriptional ArsR family regulator